MLVKRNMTCDVLVVGGGNAGLVAAIEAKNNGADVLLIEKAPEKSRGGNSRISDGLFRISCPRGTDDFEPLLKGTKLPEGKIEIEPYSEDDCYNKIVQLTQGFADRRLTEIYVTKSLETVLWMKEQGFQWDLYPQLMHKIGDRLIWSSGQVALVAMNSGEGLVEMLYGVLEKSATQVLYQTAAHSLKVDSQGKVCGVVAQDIEGFLEIKAKNVILACGGFQANPAWRRRYLGENWDLVKLRGTRYDTGDGLRMAENIGAQLCGHWGGCHATVVSEDSPMIEAGTADSNRYSYNYCILVNRKGDRFVDEGEDFTIFMYAKTGKEILKQPGSVAFQVFDAKVFHLLRPVYQSALRVESNSLEELAGEMDIDVERFLQTVRRFNDAIVDDGKPFVAYELDGRRTKGLNPDKTNWALSIDTPPYRAYAVVCGLTMTYGGVKTNEKTQVIDTCDRPINGLYAIGEITGGFFYHNYASGAGLMRGAVMGRIAGAAAAHNL